MIFCYATDKVANEMTFCYATDKVLVSSETVGCCILSTERKGSGEYKLDIISI